MASSKKKMQKTTTISAIISLVTFAYQVTLSILNLSLVLMIASISTLVIFICKFLFIKNVLETREKKKKTYLIMAFLTLIYSLIFIAFVVLKVNGIDLSKKSPFDGVYGLIFVLALLLLAILSIFNYKGAVEKTDIMVIGLKEVSLMGAVANLVFIESYLLLFISNYIEIKYESKINGFFSLGMGILMLVISIRMFIRYKKYKA